MLVSEEQVDDYVSNLRGRLDYETKKATKLGFANIQDYVRDKLNREAEALELSLHAIPSKKPAKKLASDFWPQMKAAGATDFRGTQTGPNSLRSMTLWRSREECEAALDKIRAAGSAQSGMKVVATASGNLEIELD